MTASGEQFEVVFEGQKAVLVEVGGGIRTYSVDGRDVLDGYGIDEEARAARGQLLIPWPNRLDGGTYAFEGRRHELPIDEPERRNAIHGLVRRATWTAREHETDRVVLEHVIQPRPGYPFSVALEVAYVLSSAGLRVTTRATNIGPERCPFGSGAHPYLTVGTALVDEVVLRIPAHSVLRADERALPVGVDRVEGSGYDFRVPRAIGSTVLDHCFTGLERAADGLAHVELRDPRSDVAATLWCDAAYPYVMVFTGDRPDVARRSLAVEPMTCPPNAFRSGGSLIVLEPGASHVGVWGIAPSSGSERTPNRTTAHQGTHF